MAAEFTIVNNTTKATILYDHGAPAIDSIIAHLLALDIQRVTGYLPIVLTDISKASGNVIIIGNLQSELFKNFIIPKATLNKLNGKWECYELKVLNNPLKSINQALLIVGSDNRGTAYGVFDISARIGVSPWHWWADVNPTKQKELSIKLEEYISSPPSVKYRGIFLNDEDWGLQPWAAKTFEPETGDIGPKTYAKIFELLLRLKANLIWPAMHPSTKAFYHYPGNKKVASDYCIIIGSSHAEPMLRNNVSEWEVRSMGPFNYLTNKENVDKYWEDRVKESSKNDAIYTLGMRGIHDSGIEGVSSPKEAVPLLERIFNDQREMLMKFVNKEITAVPQAFTAYKEVLDIYDNGLKLPDDVTLVWPDDNYGYIQRLNNEQEKRRKGGSGVYYHASYWGRPHDYLWLSSTSPALIREEMMKAYENKTDKLWVLNVGDLKPLEYNIQMFLDMAYNAEPFKDSRFVQSHLLTWSANIFGNDKAEKIRNVLWQYYQLAFERRPEFMGWSQTEPTTKTNYTDYNHFFYSDEAQQRIDKYEELEKEVKELRKDISPDNGDAFYELVYYPVVCASLMNKKFLYRDKSYFYAKQNRSSAIDYATLSQQAFESIVKETGYYNDSLAKGKWKNMMSMKPRDLPVYQQPVLPKIAPDTSAHWSIVPEGVRIIEPSAVGVVLSFQRFNSMNWKGYFVDLFLNGNGRVNWTASTLSNWITLSKYEGTLIPEIGKKDNRVWINIDWSKVPKPDSLNNGKILFKGAGKEMTDVIIVADKSVPKELDSYKGFVERDGYISIFASDYSRQINSKAAEWKLIEGLGHTGKSIESVQSSPVVTENKKQNFNASPCIEYNFFTTTTGSARIDIHTLPTHPQNNNSGMRYAVAIDNRPPHVMDFSTIGRSEVWKQHVLSNDAVCNLGIPLLEKGLHVLKIFMIDAGVILDRITIDLGGLVKGYGVIPETRFDSE